MYELYFVDETSMPMEKSQRFKNFQKHVQQSQVASASAPSVPRPPKPPQTPQQPEIILPDEVMEVFNDRDITETPFIFMRSNLSGKNSKGESYAVGFDEFLVIMWRKDVEPFKLVKLEHYDIIDVSGGVEESDDSVIVLMVSTEERTYSLWFQDTQTDELVTFINSWKYHQVHTIGGKTEISFDDEEPVDELDEEEVVADLPEIDGVAQKDLPRTVIFGTLLIDQVADGHNITELDLEYLNMTVSNPDLLALCIQNFKRDVVGEAKEVVKVDFNDQQKLMLISNMADLAYRNGEEHVDELESIKSFASEIGFDGTKLEDIIEVFKVKNDPSTLENY